MLLNCPLFNYGKSTREDKERTDLYKKSLLKKQLFDKTLQSNGSKEDWIKSLKIELELSMINKNNQNIDRVIQLFNRTKHLILLDQNTIKSLF